MNDEEALLADRIYQLLCQSESPDLAREKLKDLVSEQKLWTDRVDIENAIINCLLIEHFKRRSRE